MTDSEFPEGRWGAPDSRFRRLLDRPVTAFVSSRFGAWVIRHLARLDEWVLSKSKGRFTVFGPLGLPLLILTTTGAKSGLLRSHPLLFVRDGDEAVIFGSNYGQAHHPAWTHNLEANPQATVAISGAQIPVVASRVTDEKRYRENFARFVAEGRNYTAYQERADREIKMFALRRVNG